jgi:hypothetical protein
MIDNLYGKYFQKSRSFLYPALGIRKDSQFNPSGTYISLPGKYGAEDMKLIVSFRITESEDYKDFESQWLTGNPLYEEHFRVREYNIYVFDFQMYQNDWFQFITGKYSKLSMILKKAIKSYYGDKSSEYKYIDSYLFPEKYYDVYAKLLDIDAKDLKRIGELCDPWDMDRESLKIPVENLETSKKDV